MRGGLGVQSARARHVLSPLASNGRAQIKRGGGSVGRIHERRS